jgi:hypothetical protein
MNCGLRHFGSCCDGTLLSSHADLFEFIHQFSEEGRQRSKIAYRSFVHREHQSSLRRIHDTASSLFPILNVTINSKYLFVNFGWTFTFCVEISPDKLCQLSISINITLGSGCISRDRITCRDKFVILFKHIISYVLDATMMMLGEINSRGHVRLLISQ